MTAMAPDEIAYEIVNYSSGPDDICVRIVSAILAEREACAKIAADVAALYASSDGPGDPSARELAGDIEYAIINRSER